VEDVVFENKNWTGQRLLEVFVGLSRFVANKVSVVLWNTVFGARKFFSCCLWHTCQTYGVGI